MGDDSSRQKLATTINAAIDIPLLDENQEEEILLVAIQNSAETVQQLLPAELIQTLSGERPESLIAMKEYLIDQVNAKVDF